MNAGVYTDSHNLLFLRQKLIFGGDIKSMLI
jgi:hypothetical protein